MQKPSSNKCLVLKLSLTFCNGVLEQSDCSLTKARKQECEAGGQGLISVKSQTIHQFDCSSKLIHTATDTYTPLNDAFALT